VRRLVTSLLLSVALAGPTPAIPQEGSLIGEPAPKFVRPDLGGKRINLDAFRGKVVLLNFWATWCAPCRVELPTFAVWQDRYRTAGLQIIAVSMDDNSVPVGKAARKLRLNFPVIMGDDKLGMAYGGVLGLPVTFLIDRDGRILTRFGGGTDLKQMESRVRSVLSAR
jgi:peroxiredoxin